MDDTDRVAGTSRLDRTFVAAATAMLVASAGVTAYAAGASPDTVRRLEALQYIGAGGEIRGSTFAEVTDRFRSPRRGLWTAKLRLGREFVPGRNHLFVQVQRPSGEVETQSVHFTAAQRARGLLGLGVRLGREGVPLTVRARAPHAGHTTLAAAEYNIGNLLVARDHFAAARAACPPDLPRLQLDPQVLFLGLNSLVLQQLGDTAGAEAWSRDALAYATGRDEPVNLAYTYVLTSQFRGLADDRPGTIVWADRAMAVAAEHGFPLHEAAARAMKGWAVADPALQRDGYAACVATGQRVCEPMYRLGLARTYLDGDRVADAEGEIAQGLTFVAESGEARHLAELYRVRSECARRRGALADAETDLRLAIAVARAHESRLFALRAIADLAELLAGRGRVREARALLRPVCTGFVAEDQGPELDRVRALHATLKRR